MVKLSSAVFAVVVAGCGRISFDPSNGGDASTPAIDPLATLVGPIAVAAAYPANGANWLDYVVRDGSGVTDASGAPCTGAELGYTACIHGGEIREVSLPGVTSCAGITATDELGAFAWRCELRANAAIVFSTGLAEGKGLTDLITATGFTANHVTVTDSARSVSSSDAVWWSNPFAALPDNSAGAVLVLSGYPPGTIFTLAGSRATAGYNIGQDKLAFVALPGAVLSGSVPGANINYADGKLDAPLTAGTLYGAGTENFLWFEGEYSSLNPTGPPYMECVTLVNVAFTRINRLTCDGPYDGMDITGGSHSNYVSHVLTLGVIGGDDGAWVDVNASYNSFYDFTSIAHNDSGIHFDMNCGHNTLEKIRIYDSGAEGLTIMPGADGNSVDDLVIANVATETAAPAAVYIASNDNTFSRLLIVGTDTVAGHYPIYIDSASRNTFDQVTVANNRDAVRLSNASNNTFNQLAILSSGANGLDILNGGDNVVSQLVVSQSTGTDVTLTTTSSNRFPGNFLHDGTCSVSGGAAPGLVDGSCAKANAADLPATVGGINAVPMLVGAVANDAANQSASGGTAAFPASPAAFDWWRFESPYRSWATSAASGQWTSGTGQIHDYRFRAGAALVGTSGQGLGTQATGAANGAFVAGAACPAATTASAIDANGNAYLLDAVEIVDPRAPQFVTAGNHDGLCNSGEACVYLPNFGVDQGQEAGPAALAPCTFDSSGAVAGVTMYGTP